MRLTIAIATHGRPELLRRTLENLASIVPGDPACRIVVAENGGRLGAEEVTRSVAVPCRLEYLYLPRPNRCAALNAIIATAPTGLVWFLDDDVTVDREAVESYWRSADEEENQYFGGPMEPEFEEPPPSWLLPYLPRSARGWRWDPACGESLEEVGFLGANWAAFAPTLKAMGGFSDQFGPGTGSVGGETEIQRRLRAAGFVPRYLPEALVRHWVPRERCTPRWALRRAYRIGVSEGLLRPEIGGVPERTLLGYPRWMWREWLRRWLDKWHAARSPDPAVRFAAAREEALFRGWMAGYRKARHQRLRETQEPRDRLAPPSRCHDAAGLPTLSGAADDSP